MVCAAIVALAGCAAGGDRAPVRQPPAPQRASATPAVHHASPNRPARRVPIANPGEMEEAASKNSPVIGKPAVDFALPNAEEKVVKLSDFRGRWAVVYFYPADDTPGCTCQATEFTDLLARFHNLNAVVLGISPDPPILHQIFARKYALKITLLSDTKRQTMKDYGAWMQATIAGAKVERVVRSTFLIDPNGVIAWHWPEVIPEGHAGRVRDRLAKLSAARADSRSPKG